MARSLGQLLLGDAELDRPAAGAPYDGDDPDGYLPRDEITAFLERYATSFDAPVREGVKVDGLGASDDGFPLRTSGGEIAARSVVVATGAYQRPYRPRRRPTCRTCRSSTPTATGPRRRCPPGPCSSSAAASRAARSPRSSTRRVATSTSRAGGHRGLPAASVTTTSCGGGRDRLHRPTRERPARPTARLNANLLSTGRDGGHTLNLRTLARRGHAPRTVRGRARLRARFAPDLGESQRGGTSATAR